MTKEKQVKIEQQAHWVQSLNEFNKYSWTWNEKANEIGLFGESRGVIAQEVQAVNEDYVMLDKTGYLKVNYEEIV